MSRIAFRQWFRQLHGSSDVESRRISSLRFESLEDRRLLATFAVLNALDAGPGSLRAAMIAANSTPGADQIEFAIAGAAPHTINLASPLPVITEQVSIDATTQAGYSGAPVVELNGASAGAGSGFVLRSPNNAIRGFVINRFSGSGFYDQGSGIVVDGASATGNLITSNYIGTNLSGTSASQNAAQGVFIVGGASGNIIGGNTPAQRNVISGNAFAGIRIADSPNNFVRGNYIGTDASGLADLGNTQDGVVIAFPASTGNVIGGNLSNEGNLISGNNLVGINVSSPNNSVLGNVIGLSANGNVLGNSGFGVVVDNSNNTVGSSTSTNVISGNGSGGIGVGANLLNTIIIGNRIGSSIDGTAARPNQGPGIRVQLTTTAASTTIGGSLPGESNLISGNNGNGIALNGNSTLVMGNRIGTAIDGATPLPNSLIGITVDGLLNTVGSNLDGNNDALEGNIIAFNANNGVYVSGNSNNIRSNSIRSNGANGVYIAGGEFNVVGGTSSASRNVIVGHSNSVGIRVQGTSAVNRAYRNSIAGNYIGVEANGFTVNANSVGVHLDAYSQENRIGQVIDGFNLTTNANTISGNLIGVNEAADIFTISQNAIFGNLIGTDAGGNFRVRSYSIGMRPYGVVVSGSSTQVANNTIAGFFAGSFSSIGEGAGIYAYRAATPQIAANRIGTSLDGLRALPNFFGIRTELSTDISIQSNLVSGNLWHGMSVGGAGNQTNIEGNYVGLSSFGDLLGNGGDGISSSATNTRIISNVISGNGFGNAMVGNAPAGGIRIESADGVIQNNLIGLDPTGRFARGNAKYGVFVNGDNILIGTNGDGLDDDNEGNTISGQREIAITGGSPTLLPMKVRGNRVGTDISGTVAVPNSQIFLEPSLGGASQPALLVTNAEVGTNGDGISDDLERNVIAGNHGVGIDITGGYVAGNYIGVDASGTKTLGNRLAGVVVKGNGVRIGSNADSVNDDVEGNVIGGNGAAGIAIEGTSGTVLGNWIGTDSSSRFSLGNRGSGIQIGSTSLTSGVQGHSIGRTVAQPPTLENTIAFNSQAGIRVVGNNANNNVGINRYLGSGMLAIDAGNVGVTLNPTTTATTQQDFPVLTDAYIDGDEVVVRGFVRPGVTTDFYLAGPNSLKFGDGIEHLHRVVEGSASDSDATVGTYDNSTLPGLNIATGVISTNRFMYRFPRPESLQYGSRLTAVHVGAVAEAVKISEFGNSIYVGDAPGFTLPGSSLPAVVTLPGLQTVQQGEALRIQGSFTDYDSTEWTARIAFGDGTSQSVSLREDFTFEVVHTYANPGNYAVTMTVTDNALAQGFASMPVVVQNSAPEIDLNLVQIVGPVNEGTSVQLRGTFQDASNSEPHDVTIQWGDGLTSSLFIAPGQTEFTASHLYSSRGAASVLGAGVDLYQVRVSISDPSSSADSTPVGLLTAEVRNVLPRDLVTNFSASSIQVGQTLTLTSGSFSDPGLQDLHRVRVDWGDGSESIVNLGPGVTTFGNISHTYTSTPRYGTQYEVTVELIDLDQPLQSLRSTRWIEVTSAVISNINLVTNTSSLNEGELLVLGGSFTTATPSQRHRVRVNWGDGSAPTTVYLAPGSTAFGGVLHQYADDSHGTAGFDVSVEFVNLDSPGVSGYSSALVVVQNVAPIVSSFALDNLGTNGTNEEGDTVRLTGFVADDGIEDRHAITINWGDGSPLTQATVNSQTGEFEAIHRFIDQSSAITISATDDDGAATTQTLNPSVINVAPLVAIVPSATNVNPNLIELLSQVDDVLGDANFSYSWSAYPVGVPSVPVQSGGGANLIIDRTLAPTAIWNVTLTVSDNEGGSATHELSLLAGTAGNDQLTVDNTTIGGLTTDRLLVLGLGGSDVLDGSGMTDPNFQLILDGGADTDQLYGGAGNDQFYLRQGNDSANVPIGGVNLANAMAGSDRYYLVPNSTLTVYDSTGANALDFGLASFGITFDLSMNLSSTLTTQDVDPTGATGQHFVATQGAFTELVGGDFSDTLTSASNSSVYAGAGSDRLKVGSNTTGATFYGGADDDYLIASGLGISDLSFQGDDGIDALENLGTIESLVFSGGADDDYLVNRGVVLGELSFGGDDGVDYLENIAAIASLIFTGGADDDYLINRGALETLSFGGDDGVDYLENVALATIGSLVFTGGADDDYLVNRGALEVLSFGGDDGLDSLENLGVIAELVFTGGADDDSLINRGALETLSFGGDDGADFLENVALATIGTLVFTGGADDDYLINRGAVLSELTFGGDDGLDSLENLGAIAELIFTGGADDDSLINHGVLQVLTFEGGADDDSLLNLSGATISSISFQGDDGIDSLENRAAISQLVFNGGADDDYLLNVSGTITDISFNGDDGEDFLRNEATILGTLVFTGGADDDYLLNLGVLESLSFGGDGGDDYLLNIGAMESIVFTGGADDDYLINRGIVLEELSFSGDDGIDSLINSGAVEAIVFTGGADDDYLLNTVSAVVESISFQGDDGEDLLRNESVLDSIVFTGGADDDSLVNLASVAEITFSGGADDDYLLNQASEVTSISFNGDDGIDNLVNLGNAIGTLVFRGGADDDYLLNQGDAISQLVFEGGADDDTLVSRGVHTGTISFLGDDLLSEIQGNDVFILHGSGTASGTVSFSGLGGRDLLQNNATGLGSIEFLGGADDDVLQNSGDAVLSISFQGDDGADILDNSGSRVLSLQFTGGADDDYLLNEGTTVTGITFSGGADDDYLINIGDATASISFGGDDGEDVLVNRGANVADVVFTGGADNDLLINEGLNAAGVTFHGGSGSDRFLNRLAGAGSTGLEFMGDDGEDFLVNQAIDVGTISFHGGADDDSLLNYGTAVQSISFVGDDGIDTLLNSGDSITDIVFDGGSDDDVLLNLGEAVGSISFNGDDGADLLQNSGASVSAITFIGGADDDVLINNGEAVSTISFGGDDGEDILQNNAAAVGEIIFNGGADHDVLQNNGNQVGLINFMGGIGNDKLLNNGDNTNELFFGGGDGADTLLHKGRGLSALLFEGGHGTDVLRVAGFNVGVVTFIGGDGADSMVYEASRDAGGSPGSVVFNGDEGNDLLAWLGAGPVSLLADGGSGDDTFAIGGEGQLNLVGGTGSDYFVFQGAPLAQVQIDETSVDSNNDSVDTLDFSTFADGPLNLDLRSLDAQPQGATFSITLTDSTGIENVFGTHRGDTILGNARNNVISGAEFIEPEALPIAPRRAAPQWVYLDFDSKTQPTLGEHAYTQLERDAIQAGIESVYHGQDSDPNDPSSWWFNVRFTQNLADLVTAFGVSHASELPQDRFVTILFNETPSFGRPGGEASEIDMGNLNLGGIAVVQLTGMLGGQLSPSDLGARATDPLGDNVEGDIKIGARKPVANSENFVALSVKIAAHELGHLLGLRHHDTFGPVGFGIHTTPGPAEYSPAYTGPAGAFEAVNHLLGSGASIGTDRFNDLRQLFFGEREAVKLVYAMSDFAAITSQEQGGLNQSRGTAQQLSFIGLDVPNTLRTGLNAGKTFDVKIASVLGAIEHDSENKSESDFYKFSGKRGEVFTIEVSSLSLRNNRVNIDHWIDSVLRVTDANGATVSWFGGQAFNDDEFESSDSSIIDLVLPYDGEYFIEVDTFARSSSSPTYPQAAALRAELESIANPTAAQLETLERLRDSLDDQDIGNYQLLVYRFAQANANDEIDTLKGNGGLDLIVGGPGDDYSTVLSLGVAVSVDIDSLFQRSIEFMDRAASSWIATVDYGDGTGVQPLPVTLNSSGEPSFELSHDYSSLGEFTVTVTVTNDLQIQTIAVLPISAVNLVPSVAIESIENHGGGSELQEGAEVLVAITSANFDGGSDPLSVSVVVSRVGSSTVFASQTAAGLNTFRFTPDDNGQYEVIVTATDVRNKVSRVSQVVTVLNVAPTITSSLLPTTGIEGTMATFTAVATDAGSQDDLLYSWDFGDGTITTGTNVTHSYADNGAYLVVFTVTDKDGATSTVNRSIVISNADPTIVNSVIPSSTTVGVTTQFAVTASDLGANENLIYQWSFGDGAFATGSSVTHMYTTAGSFTVALLVLDKDSGSVSRSQSVTVTGGNVNNAPALSIAGPQQVVRGQLVTVVFTATDANPQDQVGTFTYRINWGDGTPVEIVNGPATVAVSHTYTSSGTTSIIATVTDARGAVSAPASKSIGVVNWLKHSDPLNPGDSMLVIGGSMGADEIRVDYQQGRRWLRVRMNGETALFANESGGNKLIDRLVIYGQNGNDLVHVDNQINLPSLIDGGSDNDYIEAGRGNNILIGGAGNDTLIAEGGADLLVGGQGNDLLMGGNGQDLLIAGYTTFDTNRQALESIMAEWGRDSSYNTRRRNLLGQTNNGLNGGVRLLSNGPQRTVFDDASIDRLLGQEGTDWYFANIDCGGIPDLLLDLQNNEEEEDID